MTLPYSGAIFVQAFPRECTETFLEGHRRAFEFFGGVPARISYDNSAIAVIEVRSGRERKLTQEFLRLQSHYLFQEHFCLVRRANEKGHVERLLGFARRNFLVPVPEVDSLETLNRQLCERCLADLAERTRGKPAPKQELLRRRSGGLPAAAQAIVRGAAGRAEGTAELRVAGSLRHQRLLRAGPVRPSQADRGGHGGRGAAGVPRTELWPGTAARWDREQAVSSSRCITWRLLERKPGGFDHARPLEHWDLPECFTLLRRRLEADDSRHGTR